MNRHPLVWLSLRWPREVTDKQVLALWNRLPALAGWPLVVEAIGEHGQVRHRLAVPVTREQAVTRQLRAELPGISVEQDSGPPLDGLNAAGDVRPSTRRRAVKVEDLASASRAILTALSAAGRDETVLLQFVLGQPLHPQPTRSGSTPLAPESWIGSLVDAAWHPSRPNDHEPVKALAEKQGRAGWRARIRLAVRAKSPQRRSLLLGELAGALRAQESPGLRLVVYRQRATRAERAAIPWLWPVRLNADELASLSAWPVGTTAELPVQSITSRQLVPSPAIPRDGRIVAEAAYPGRERPLALTAASGLRHLHVIGPTGTGKSTLLLNLIAQDIAAGRGAIVIEPKGDLIRDVLACIPAERTQDVVLLDATDTERPVGFNPLAPNGRPADLVADQLLGLFHAFYVDHWGPRTQDILGAAFMTLAQVPGSTLTAIPLLLSNAAYRQQILGQINDPVGLGPFWDGFERWSEAERTVATAPALNRLRPFLMRPGLRRILSQAEPRFGLRQVFTERKVLLVNLAKGQLGPETAALLGALLLTSIWQAALGRSAIPRSRRHPVFLYIDEFQDYLRTPIDLADVLVQARGLGLGLVMAHQHLSQLPLDVRSTVLENAGSRVAFRLSPADGKVLAAGSQLDGDDFAGLGAYECYVRLLANDTVQPWASARSYPPPVPISDPAVVRAASRGRYGQDRAAVDAAIERLLNGRDADDVDDLTPRRRGGQR
ncbi:MAG TPA: hypothetical protein VHB02_04935 [Acidimicrobiales bacterium]|nr:hypothetical protein [Acidimicrobiales bacterium]